MSEREGGSGAGGFLLGLVVGAALGFLFAPEPGGETRRRVAGKLRQLRDHAAEQAGALGELVEQAREDAAATAEVRQELKRRIVEARRRRHAVGAARSGGATGAGEEDEPLA